MGKLIDRTLRLRWGKKGQSTAEYIIIIALVAIGSIAVITVFGNQVRDVFRASTEQLSGVDTAQVDSNIGADANNHVDKDIGRF